MPEHLKQSFPVYKVCFTNSGGAENLDPRPPFRIRLPKMLKNNTNSTPGKTKSSTDSMNDVAMEDADGEKEKLIVEAYMPPDPGPYANDQPRQNSVRFTPPYRLKPSPQVFSQDLQWLSVHLGHERHTAVQILNFLYHNCPTQRTLIITHSNQALNDLFEKIMQRDVPTLYLL